MNSIVVFMCWVFTALVLFSSEYIDSVIVYEKETYVNAHLPDDGKISCICNGRIMNVGLPRSRLNEFLIDIKKAGFDIDYYPIEVSNLLMRCSNCTAKVIICKSTSPLKYGCIEKEVTMVHGHNPDKVGSVSKDRKRRGSYRFGQCNFPTNLETSHLSCTEYPSSIKCIQRCIYGYTLEEGIVREMNCVHGVNVWNPLGFQECSRFIDCTMTLTETGWKSCRVGTPYIPHSCNVTCDRYEDKPAIPLTLYKCDVSTGWNKKLPHCVFSGSGLATVPAPKIKLHTLPEKSDPKKPTGPKAIKEK